MRLGHRLQVGQGRRNDLTIVERQIDHLVARVDMVHGDSEYCLSSYSCNS